MNYYFITGTSKGLGKALTQLLLKDATNKVIGFARTCTIEHPNYTHVNIDFNQLDAVEDYRFPKAADATRIILVNNAGTVGDIKHVGEISNQKIKDCYTINLIAPTIFTNNFVSAYSNTSIDKLIVNISSGAGRSPIDGWSVYCASKAGLDMFSQVLNEEIQLDKNRFKVLSLAPGIIDTAMQTEIRTAQPKGFSNVDKFIEYKKKGDLASPELTAKQVLQFLKNPTLAANTLCSVRDLPS